MGIGTWGWGSSCGGLVTSWGWGQCPCVNFIPGLIIDDLCGTSVRTCVDIRLRPGELDTRLWPSELALRARPAEMVSRSVDNLASRARPTNVPSRSRICDE